jgi:hypothetical protein
MASSSSVSRGRWACIRCRACKLLTQDAVVISAHVPTASHVRGGVLVNHQTTPPSSLQAPVLAGEDRRQGGDILCQPLGHDLEIA